MYINYTEKDNKKMSNKQVIQELSALIAGFEEEYEACPICLYEAVRIINEMEENKNGKQSSNHNEREL